MSVQQLESQVLALPEAERRRFLDWLDDHRHELLPDEDEVSEAVQQEILRRSAELEANPGLAVPVTDEWFDDLKRKLADAPPRSASAR